MDKGKRRIVHSIYAYKNDVEYSEIDRAVRSKSGNDILIVVDHKKDKFNHVHVIHKCSWSTNSCRCSWAGYIIHLLINRNRGRYCRPIGEQTRELWIHLLLHLLQDPTYVWVLLHLANDADGRIFYQIINHATRRHSIIPRSTVESCSLKDNPNDELPGSRDVEGEILI